MVRYYKLFFSGLTTAAAPLTNMLSTRHKFEWTEVCGAAFKGFKNPVDKSTDPLLTRY